LVIVSSRNVFLQKLAETVKRQNLSGVVNLVGFVPEEDLGGIYKEAMAVVQPSLSEGFGIPGLNAMAAGLPVVCSDIPVLHEVYGEAAIYFNPHDPKDIAGKIKKVLTSDTGSELAKKGREQVKKYSWQKMAQETLEVYEST